MLTGAELAEHWMTHRRVTEALLERIPDDRADFRPWSEAMTTVELAGHIAVAHSMVTSIAAGLPFERPAASTLPTDMATVRAFVHQATAADRAALCGMDSAALARQVTFMGGEDSAQAMLALALEHEIHHKGQLFEYARMNDVQDVPTWIMP
jgi:uncharacterized damage-inducible protein DinB